MPPDLAEAIDQVAARNGTTFSGWLAETAAHRLHLEAGRRALAAWEREHGALTPEERAVGRSRARALVGPPSAKSAKRSA